MKFSALFSALSLIASVTALPITFNRRSALPFVGGVNLAGCDFGMSTDGTSGTSYCPGTSQISHFVDQGANVFRLPVGWQYLMTSASSTSLDGSQVSTFDTMLQAVTATGAYALIDIHNYARWNGAIIGQGGPTDAQFAKLWSLLATKYASNDKVIFGLMNEPHDVDINTWATTCQTAVNAIRAAGATTQTILLPGNSWDTASYWSGGNNAPMLDITDPSSSDKSLLVLDVHKYFDSDGSGSSTTCTNNGLDLFTPLLTYLKTNNRKAFVSEFGGGNNDGCVSYVSEFLTYITANEDYFAGFTAWSAGAFATDYTLSLTPNSDGSDQTLFTGAIKPYLPGVSSSTSTTKASTSAAATTSTKAATTVATTSTKAATTVATTTKASTTSTKATVSSAVASTVAAATTSAGASSSSIVAAVDLATSGTATSAGSCSSSSAASTSTVTKWGQCGGANWTGSTTCVSGSTCTYQNDWYSQCL
ncbi:uncharacterized protein EHS24_002502 [Apiotrichum porosum]|uniref:cellulase n=1 Tax=Apiotrichum porosum TaxID=105984 RepID=A0A427XH09_9TREE|nr:uncharacterized protein EHS24_002502 [Apiotrichum porosum]RSH78047.1 hypothetical protein EHS24_002502 [Apiotrichum porosum]